jgi:hypothetical protein
MKFYRAKDDSSQKTTGVIARHPLIFRTGRIIRDDKRGAPESDLPPILQRLSLDGHSWKTLTTEFELRLKQWVSSEYIMRQVCSEKHYQRIESMRSSRQLLT